MNKPDWSHQQAAHDAVFKYWERGGPGSPLIEVATGGGKSRIMGSIAATLVRDMGARCLILAHRKELIRQNTQAVLTVWPDAHVGVWSAGVGQKTIAPITVVGVQSAWRKPAAFGHIDVAIVDEAHLISGEENSMYGKLLAGLRHVNPDMRLIGLTATPYRLGQGLLTEGENKIFDCVIYKAGPRELVDRGVLVPLVSEKQSATIDTAGVKVAGGDYVAKDLELASDLDEVNEAVAQDVAGALARGRKSALVFGAGVQHAHHLRNALAMAGVQAEVVVGDTPNRDHILARYKAQQLQCVVSCDVLCLDAETDILTSDGWVGIDGMTMEHKVANWDDGKVFFDVPKLVVRRDRMPDERMVVLDSKTLNVRVTANHRMLARTGDGKFTIRPAADLVGRRVRVPISGEADPLKISPRQPTPVSDRERKKRVRASSYVLRKNGMADAEAKAEAANRLDRRLGLRYTEPSELSLDECRFIGFWCGDGTVDKNGRYSAAQSMVYPKIIEWFDGVIAGAGVHCSKHVYPERLDNGVVSWSFSNGTGSGPQERPGLFHLKPYLDKNGSPLLAGLESNQFAAFMEGLWMADGLHGQGMHRPKTMLISSTNFAFLSRIQSVAVCRGYRCRIRGGQQKKNPNHNPIYQMATTKKIENRVVSKRFQFEDAPFKPERVWCVTSTTGNIITRRKGSVTVTGNTTGFDAPCTDVLALVRATLSPGLYCQIMGRGMRRFDGKQDALVYDYGGNIARHGPITEIRVKPRSLSDGKGLAPIKTCPQCNAEAPASARTCVHCDFEFPPPEKKANATASALNPMGDPNANKPRTVRVASVDCQSWLKKNAEPGKPPTLRVRFMDDYGKEILSEYMCLEHTGFPRHRAEKMWAHFFKWACPPEGPGAVAMGAKAWDLGAMRAVRSVTYKMEGKYPRLVAADIAPDGISQEDCHAAPREPGVDLDGSGEVDPPLPMPVTGLDEIPF